MFSFKKLFSDENKKALKMLEPIVARINSCEKEISALSDSELSGKTTKLKKTINDGKSLDDILPEAFAIVRETAKRTLGQRHFDAQLMGGVEHQNASVPKFVL